jgi:hypothetical protein
MPKAKRSPLNSPLEAPRVREAARALIEALQEEAQERELNPRAYDRALRDIQRLRGQPLIYPAISSGVGRGARVRLANGLRGTCSPAPSTCASPERCCGTRGRASSTPGFRCREPWRTRTRSS